jgi:hypothetical protein
MKKLIVAAALAALPLSFALQAPAFAQASSYTPGSFWDVTGIKFKDGGGEKYLDWLSSDWKKQQDFAKSKGWIEDYMVVANAYPRDGEPDLWLMIKYKSVPDAAEQVRRNAAMEAFLKQDPHQADAASGQRGAMRTIKESLMLQELKLK